MFQSLKISFVFLLSNLLTTEASVPLLMILDDRSHTPYTLEGRYPIKINRPMRPRQPPMMMELLDAAQLVPKARIPLNTQSLSESETQGIKGLELTNKFR